MDNTADNIQVMVRVRPLNDRERKEDAKSCIIIDEDKPKQLILDCKSEQKPFHFDYVVDQRVTQLDIFNISGKPLSHVCLEGYNGCIFAYGQTGAGKTYTMQGRGLEEDSTESVHRGLQPRVFDYLFDLIKRSQDTEYVVKCSYLEIYNESIMDLLSPSGNNLQVREDLKRGVYVEGLSEEVAKTGENAIECLRKGARNRHVGATQMNAESSRSHSVFSLTIESKKNASGLIHMKSSKLHFVDLAGSERQKQTAAAGDRLKEASNINKSLTVLGQVINSLVEIAEGKKRHIAYRDSKLTFMLKDSLGGNSKTFMIAAVSVANTSFQETLSTLKFAQRAKMIKNKASVNEESSGNLEGLKKEIKRLKEELMQSKQLVSTLELDSKKQMKYSPSQLQQFNPEILSKVNQYNQEKYNEIEVLLKQSLGMWLDFEVAMQTELSKRDSHIQVFKSSVDFYENTELSYKTIMNLYQDRICRYQMNEEIEQIDEINRLRVQIQYLEDILRNTQITSRLAMENIYMKEIIDELEGEVNPTSSLSVINYLRDNILVFHSILDKLNEIGPVIRGVEEENLGKKSVFKKELNVKVEEFNKQILELRHHEQKLLIEVQQEKDKNLLIQKKLTEKEKEYQYLQEDTQRRIQDIRDQQYNVVQNQSQSLDEKEQQMNQLIIQLNDIKECLRISQKENEEYCSEKIWLERELEQIRQEKNEKEYEKADLQNQIESYKNQLENVAQLNEIDQDERQELITENQMLLEQFKVAQEKYDVLKNALEMKIKENYEEKENVQRLLEKKEEEQREIERTYDKIQQQNEELELECRRNIEEIDTLQRVKQYLEQELHGKKDIVDEVMTRIVSIENELNIARSQLNEKESNIRRLSNQIEEHYNENSPYILAMKENNEIKQQLEQIRLKYNERENEFKENENKVNVLYNEINNLRNEEEKYKKFMEEANKVVNQQTQIIKENQEILNQKISEFNELIKELEDASEQIRCKDEEIQKQKKIINEYQKDIIELGSVLTESSNKFGNIQDILKEKDYKLGILECNYNELFKEFEGFQKTHSDIINQMNQQREQQLKENEKNIKRVKDKLENEKYQVIQQLEDKSKWIQDQIVQKEQRISELVQRVEELSGQLVDREYKYNEEIQQINQVAEDKVKELVNNFEKELILITQQEQECQNQFQEQIEERDNIIKLKNEEIQEKIVQIQQLQINKVEYEEKERLIIEQYELEILELKNTINVDNQKMQQVLDQQLNEIDSLKRLSYKMRELYEVTCQNSQKEQNNLLRLHQDNLLKIKESHVIESEQFRMRFDNMLQGIQNTCQMQMETFRNQTNQQSIINNQQYLEYFTEQTKEFQEMLSNINQNHIRQINSIKTSNNTVNEVVDNNQQMVEHIEKWLKDNSERISTNNINILQNLYKEFNEQNTNSNSNSMQYQQQQQQQQQISEEHKKTLFEVSLNMKSNFQKIQEVNTETLQNIQNKHEKSLIYLQNEIQGIKYIERELRIEVDNLRQENIILKEKVSQYEKICENASANIIDFNCVLDQFSNDIQQQPNWESNLELITKELKIQITKYKFDLHEKNLLINKLQQTNKDILRESEERVQQVNQELFILNQYHKELMELLSMKESVIKSIKAENEGLVLDIQKYQQINNSTNKGLSDNTINNDKLMKQLTSKNNQIQCLKAVLKTFKKQLKFQMKENGSQISATRHEAFVSESIDSLNNQILSREIDETKNILIDLSQIGEEYITEATKQEITAYSQGKADTATIIQLYNKIRAIIKILLEDFKNKDGQLKLKEIDLKKLQVQNTILVEQVNMSNKRLDVYMQSVKSLNESNKKAKKSQKQKQNEKILSKTPNKSNYKLAFTDKTNIPSEQEFISNKKIKTHDEQQYLLLLPQNIETIVKNKEKAKQETTIN